MLKSLILPLLLALSMLLPVPASALTAGSATSITPTESTDSVYPDLYSLRNSAEASRGTGAIWVVQDESETIFLEEVNAGGNTGWGPSPGGVEWNILPSSKSKAPAPQSTHNSGTYSNADSFDTGGGTVQMAALLTTGTIYDTPADLKSSSETSRGTGSVWVVDSELGIFLYKEVASGGNTGWGASSGGVEWDVLPDAAGWGNAYAFDLVPGDSSSNDNTDALQAAINAGFSKLRLPAGIYRYTELTVGDASNPYPDRIEGAGRHSIAGTVLKPLAGTDVVGLEITKARFFVLSDIQIDMSATSGTGSKGIWAVDLQFKNKIQNVRVRYCDGAGIYVDNPSGSNWGTTIEHCFVEQCGTEGIYFSDTAGSIRDCNVRRCGTPLKLLGGHSQVFGGIYEKSGDGPNIDIHGTAMFISNVWTESQGSPDTPGTSLGREHVRVRPTALGTYISGLRTSEGRSIGNDACDILIEDGSQNTTVIGGVHSGYDILAYKVEDGATGVHIINPTPNPSTTAFTLIEDHSGKAMVEYDGQTTKSIHASTGIGSHYGVGFGSTFSRRVHTNSSSATILEFDVPPTSMYMFIEANIIGARAINKNDAKTVRVAKAYFVVARRANGYDVELINDPEGHSWESLGLFDLGGSRVKNQMNATIARTGTEDSNSTQGVAITLDAGTSGSGNGDVVAYFNVTSIEGPSPTF